MKISNKEIIEEVEYCKDIYWYIKGQIDVENNSPFNREHLEALLEVVSFVENNYTEVKVEETNEKR